MKRRTVLSVGGTAEGSRSALPRCRHSHRPAFPAPRHRWPRRSGRSRSRSRHWRRGLPQSVQCADTAPGAPCSPVPYPCLPADRLHFAPPSLHYRYPPPTVEILTNIMNSLIAVPRLYIQVAQPGRACVARRSHPTLSEHAKRRRGCARLRRDGCGRNPVWQVLHLMNKMNLPPPFGPVTETPPLVTRAAPTSIGAAVGSERAPGPAPGRRRQRDELVASDESELDSDEESAAQGPGPRRRRVDNPAIVAPPAVLPPRGDHAPSPWWTAERMPPDGVCRARMRPLEGRGRPADPLTVAPCAHCVPPPSPEPPALATVLAAKNYAPGAPSDTLYIKNVAPEVTLVDLAAFFATPPAASGLVACVVSTVCGAGWSGGGRLTAAWGGPHPP